MINIDTYVKPGVGYPYHNAALLEAMKCLVGDDRRNRLATKPSTIQDG